MLLTVFLSHSFANIIFLPRQARDKHRESTQKHTVFSQGLYEELYAENLFNMSDYDGFECAPAPPTLLLLLPLLLLLLLPPPLLLLPPPLLLLPLPFS
jgi:hypothetical protein